MYNEEDDDLIPTLMFDDNNDNTPTILHNNINNTIVIIIVYDEISYLLFVFSIIIPNNRVTLTKLKRLEVIVLFTNPNPEVCTDGSLGVF